MKCARRVMLLAAGFVALAGCVALVGCETRDPTNPLDPENPETGGKPEWLAALADDNAVDLTWDVPFYEDLAEVRVVRADTGEILWSGGVGAGSLRDAGRQNGVVSAYRIDLRLTAGGILDLAREEATPGPEVPWVVDGSSGRLRRLTPDGRHVRWTSPLAGGSSVIADPESGGALLLDGFAGSLRRLDREGKLLWRVDDLARPFAGLRTEDGWWIADAGSGVVVLLDDAGARVAADSSFSLPVDLAPAGPGLVWVADRQQGLARLGAAARDTVTTAVPRASFVSGTQDGGAWALDLSASALVRIGADGVERARQSGYFGVSSLAADPVDGDAVWAADAFRGRVLLLDGAGLVVASVGNRLVPEDLAVSPGGDVLWVADSGLGVVRFTRDGQTLGVVQGVGAGLSVSVAFAPVR